MRSWNVKGLNWKKNKLSYEFTRSKSSSLAISETKKKSKYYRLRRRLHFKHWRECSDRIQSIYFKDKNQQDILFIAVYGPSKDDLKENKNKLWYDLTLVKENSKRKAKILLTSKEWEKKKLNVLLENMPLANGTTTEQK